MKGRDFVVIGVLVAAIAGGMHYVRRSEQLATALAGNRRQLADTAAKLTLKIRRDSARADSVLRAAVASSNFAVVNLPAGALTVKTITPAGVAAAPMTTPFMVPGADTSAMSTVQRPIDAKPWLVPTFFVQSWSYFRTAAFELDSLNRGYIAQRNVDNALVMSANAENQQLRRCCRARDMAVGGAIVVTTAALLRAIAKAVASSP